MPHPLSVGFSSEPTSGSASCGRSPSGSGLWVEWSSPACMLRQSRKPDASRLNSTASKAFLRVSEPSQQGSEVSSKELLRRYLDECPLVAIVRGITPDEAVAIGESVREGGIRIIEVPLNSPDPMKSIELLAKTLGDSTLIGAGTVLRAEQVGQVKESGGQIIVSPDSNTDVIAATAEAGLISSPGYFTPSEAFAASRAGATALKLFPAEAASPSGLKAHLAVLPIDIPLLIVGGIRPDNMQPWLDAGATGFGLGSGLYKPGQSQAE